MSGSIMNCRLLALTIAMAAGVGCGSSTKPQVKQCALNSDCASPLVCGQGYCVGQCVTGRDCSGGQDCIILPAGKVCQALAKRSCHYHSDCSPLFCGVDLQCRNQCQADVDCPSGDKCANDAAGIMLCVDPLNDASNYDPATNTIKPAPDAGVSTGGQGGNAAGGNAAGRNGAAGGTAGAAGAAAGGSGTGGAGGKGGASAGGQAGGGHGGTGGYAGSSAGGGSPDGGLPPYPWPPAKWHLWVLENNTKHLYGYNPAQLLTTNGDAPEIDLSLPGMNLQLNDIRFDPNGNLWISLSQSNVGYFWKLDAGQLAASGPVTPAAVLKTVGAYNNWTGSLDFDKAGNLWANEINTGDPGNSPGTIARFNAATVASLTTTSGMVTPEFTITAKSGPPGIAIDDAGNLYTWLAGSRGAIARYDATQIVGSGNISDPPALSIPNPTSGAYTSDDLLLIPSGLAVATTDLYLFTKSQIAQSGSPASLAPQAHITFAGVTGFRVVFLAIDPDGNLFVGAGSNKILKLSAADISAAAGAVTLTPVMNLRAPTVNPSAAFAGMAAH